MNNPVDTSEKHVEAVDISSGRYLNETAIRNHALKCSATYRAGKFTRVGQDFLDEVKADVEQLLRNVRNQGATFHPAIEPDENTSCVTGLFADKVMAELNRLICRIIQSKVQRQPTVGKTLGRTR